MVDSRSRIAVVCFGALLCAPISAQVTQRVSVDSGGGQVNGDSYDVPSISADGRFVAFGSAAPNLVPGDLNGAADIFVHDRETGTTERVSLDLQGAEGNDESASPRISADGRYVAFYSRATNLFPSDSNGAWDVFVHDRRRRSTDLVSADPSGAPGNGNSGYYLNLGISADGRFVVFESSSTNLVPGDTNENYDVFVRDLRIGTTERASVATGGAQGYGLSEHPSISADGRYVAFVSAAPNLVPGDTNGDYDVFVRDRRYGTTERVSVTTAGAQGNANSYSPSISANGRYVAFASTANNFVPGDTNEVSDGFVHDRWVGTTERVSVATGGTQGNDNSYSPRISANGRYVVFHGTASNLVLADTNATWDVFVRDRQNGTTNRVSLATSGAEGNDTSAYPSISADARYVAFGSAASNLVPGDSNGAWDVLVHDRDASGFTTTCDPGMGGVLDCPCSNMPDGVGRGCNNSAATGGAALSATGIAYLAIDSLVFTTTGENPNALSILLQGNAAIPAGLPYGHGVRCVGGTILRRLFTKSASAGSITVPDFAAGDPTISSRSAAKGDVVRPGQSRWYLVTYRDPVEMGGCSGSIRFNATQTGRITWWP